LVSPKRGSALDVTLKVNGEVVAEGQVPITAAFAFTANDCLDFGSDLGSPVSTDYYDLAPFAFNGEIGTTKVSYPKK
jgi:arylsulfatase